MMIIIIRALPQWGKDDGDYDYPISRDETANFTKKIKEAKEAQKREAKEAHQKIKKMREKERRGNVTILLP